MAYLFKRKKSKYWWVGFRDPFGVPRQESTKCKVGVPYEERRARQVCAKKSLGELSNPDISTAWGWVEGFFSMRYSENPVTMERYKSAWATISLFLRERSITHPHQLSRQHCFDYMAWRRAPNPNVPKYNACHNTALLELKVLRIIMQEAATRDLCQGNPCVKLGFKKQTQKPKPVMTAEVIERIRREIAAIQDAKDREFFQLSFEIARYQGCRLKETSLNPMEDVEIFTSSEDGKTKSGHIRFRAKGGRDFVTLLHPELIKTFEELKATGRTYTWRTPKDRGRQWASAKWFRFLRDVGLKSSFECYTFHCTRVTVITEMFLNNVPENKAKQYVGHASSTTHRIYQRAGPKDLSECVHAIAKTKT